MELNYLDEAIGIPRYARDFGKSCGIQIGIFSGSFDCAPIDVFAQAILRRSAQDDSFKAF
jgi:hypothetical protein